MCEALFFFLYLVLDLNFFPKALSSSGTDNVRVKEPSDSDLTTRASRERWDRIIINKKTLQLVYSLKTHTHERTQPAIASNRNVFEMDTFHGDRRVGQKDHFWASVAQKKKKKSNPSLTLLIRRGILSRPALSNTRF